MGRITKDHRYLPKTYFHGTKAVWRQENDWGVGYKATTVVMKNQRGIFFSSHPGCGHLGSRTGSGWGRARSLLCGTYRPREDDPDLTDKNFQVILRCLIALNTFQGSGRSLAGRACTRAGDGHERHLRNWKNKGSGRWMNNMRRNIDFNQPQKNATKVKFQQIMIYSLQKNALNNHIYLYQKIGQILIGETIKLSTLWPDKGNLQGRILGRRWWDHWVLNWDKNSLETTIWCFWNQKLKLRRNSNQAQVRSSIVRRLGMEWAGPFHQIEDNRWNCLEMMLDATKLLRPHFGRTIIWLAYILISNR